MKKQEQLAKEFLKIKFFKCFVLIYHFHKKVFVDITSLENLGSSSCAGCVVRPRMNPSTPWSSYSSKGAN
jgi:hypothetical protein